MFNFKVGQKYLTVSGKTVHVMKIGVSTFKQWIFMGDDTGGCFYNEVGVVTDKNMQHMDICKLIND